MFIFNRKGTRKEFTVSSRYEKVKRLRPKNQPYKKETFFDSHYKKISLEHAKELYSFNNTEFEHEETNDDIEEEEIKNEI